MHHRHLLVRVGKGALVAALLLFGSESRAQDDATSAPEISAPALPKLSSPRLTSPSVDKAQQADAGADAEVDAGPADAGQAEAARDAAPPAEEPAKPEEEPAREAPPPPPPPAATVAPQASAVPEPLPPPPPAPPASAPPLERGEAAPVKFGDNVVFYLYAARGDKAPEQRARAATKALAGVMDKAKPEDVRVSRQGDVAVVMVGQTPIVQLGEIDAKISGDSSLDVHAANVAAQLRRAVETERQRSEIAKLVFSISLVVFFALIAVYLMRKLGEFADRARAWLEERGEGGLSVRIRDIEVLSPATIQSTALIAVGLGKLLGQFGVLYCWLVVVLSLFDATRGYTQRLTGFVLAPLSQMMTRLATSLPLLVILTIAGLAVYVLVRFVRLFFRSVERRETQVPWMPADLAGAASILIRAGIVLLALMLAGPVVTGDEQGAFARLSVVALAALGLASVPLLANGLVGTYVVFGRRLRVGQHVEIAGHVGRISGLDLMEVRVDGNGGELRFPHLYLLRQPTRVFGLRPRVSLDVVVAAEEKPLAVLTLLEQVANRFGREARVELVHADLRGLVYRVSVSTDSLNARSELSLAVLDALAADGIKLGLAESKVTA